MLKFRLAGKTFNAKAQRLNGAKEEHINFRCVCHAFAALCPCVFALKKLSRGMNENEISKIIVTSAIEVHRELGGPGLIEGVYEEAMVEELTRHGLQVERQLQVPIFYKGKRLGNPLRLDLKINGLVLVDNKAVNQWNPVFEAQMLTYLRLTGLKLGLVINFGEQFVKNGIRRVVNGLCEFGGKDPGLPEKDI
jgi:GxxExxY protein